MRLNQLQIQGFGAFRDPTSFDFEDADFFALVGPTGSGKSTVIDAVCFALYGAVPRYEDLRSNRYVITLGASEAKVSLDFDLNGSRYVATRVVRRTPKGQVSTKEARLERVETDGTIVTMAGAEREMTPAVEGLLHLGFKDFTRCVALPQGEFADFLRAKGDDRRQLLIRLLNFGIYQRVGQRAGKVAETAKAQIALRRQDAESLADATPEALKSAQVRAKSLTKLTDDLNKSRPKIVEYMNLAEREGQAAEEAVRLAGLLEEIAVPDEVRRHGEKHKQATEHLTNANRDFSTARSNREDAEAATKNLPALADLFAVTGAHERLSELVGELEEAKDLVTGAEQKDDAARLAVEEGAQQVTAAIEELEAIRSAQQAADLAQTLVVGQPCPVCCEIVTAIPDHETPKELSKAQAAEDKAKQNLTKLQAAHRQTSSAVAAGRATVTGLEGERTRLLEQVRSYPDVLALTKLRDDVEAKHKALEDARKDEYEKNGARERAQKSVDDLAADVTAFQAAYHAQRDPVASLSPPQAGKGSVLADWEALASWAAPTKTMQQKAAERAEAKEREYQDAAGNALRGFVERATELDVSAAGDVVDVLTALSGASVEANVQVEHIQSNIQKLKQIEEEIKQTTERSEVANMVHTHLRSDHFPEWLVAEALELLVADASKTLRILTNGTFSLALGDNEFMVVDHDNADELRSARTLSGGETFQASLALALALSDQIRTLAAEGAPQLDALFLDEGFGTLDPETLDTVASTIENLGQSGRMVGVISHVRELAERVPVRFEIRKGVRSARVEKVYA